MSDTPKTKTELLEEIRILRERVAELLIETQQEMRKVAWSSRSEVIGATTVVLVTVIILAVFILVTDLMVRGLFILIRLYG